MEMVIFLLAIPGNGGDSRGKNGEIIFLVLIQYLPMADMFCRSSRLVGTEGIFIPAKPIPAILPSHANLGRREEDSESLAPHLEAVLAC